MSLLRIMKEDITDDQIIGVVSAINGAKGFLQRVEMRKFIVIYNHEGDNNLDSNIYDSKRKLAEALALDKVLSFDTQEELFNWISSKR